MEKLSNCPKAPAGKEKVRDLTPGSLTESEPSTSQRINCLGGEGKEEYKAGGENLKMEREGNIPCGGRPQSEDSASTRHLAESRGYISFSGSLRRVTKHVWDVPV